jgi:hypothetical protein
MVVCERLPVHQNLNPSCGPLAFVSKKESLIAHQASHERDELQTKLWNAAHEVFGILPLEAFSRAATVLQVVGREDRKLGAGCESEMELPPDATRPIRLQLNAISRIDVAKLNKARATLARIRNP